MPLDFIDKGKLAVSVVKQANRQKRLLILKTGVLKNFPQSWVKITQIIIT